MCKKIAIVSGVCLQTVSASGGLGNPDPLPGLCSWTPLRTQEAPGLYSLLMKIPGGATAHAGIRCILHYQHKEVKESDPVICVLLSAPLFTHEELILS